MQNEERNIGVEANTMTGLAAQIALEIPHATSELFEDDDLRLDVANLLRDNSIKGGLVRHSVIRTMQETHCFVTSWMMASCCWMIDIR
jgi:hypothetical protein